MHADILVSLHSRLFLKVHKEPQCKCTVFIFSMAKTKAPWWDRKRTMNKLLYRKQQFHPHASGKFSLICETHLLAWTSRLGGGRWWVKVRLNTANLHEHPLRLPLLSSLPPESICLGKLFDSIISGNMLALNILHSSCFCRKSRDWAREGRFHLCEVVTDVFQISATSTTRLFTLEVS